MKLKEKVITKVINNIGEQLFNFLKGCDAMGIDINMMLKDTDDFDIFWQNVHKSFQDYTGGIENE